MFGGSSDSDARNGSRGPAGMTAKQQANSDMRKHDSSSMGLTDDDVKLRKAEAMKPYKVKSAGGKVVDIKSSARAQQILQKGTAARMTQDKKAEMKRTNNIAHGFRYAIVGVVATCGFLLLKEYIVPLVNVRRDRNARMQRRHDEHFKPSMERLMAQRAAEDAAAHSDTTQ
jgi:hypothetical protein